MHLILNPLARDGAGRRLRPYIERELRRRGFEVTVTETTAQGHALELAREAARAGDPLLVAAGGDGTVHEVVNGLMAAGPGRTVLGLIPIGTGNDFVKAVPGTATPEQALATLAAGAPAAVDVGVARWDGRTEYFINAMGTGIDVDVVRYMRRSRFLPGAFIYVSALLRALARYRPLPITITVDGAARAGRIMNLAVCNGPSIGGSFRICPDARPDDRLLDVCVIGEMPLIRNARMVPRVLRGTHTGQPGVTMLRGEHLHLRTADARPLHFQLDGELRCADDGAAGIEIGLAPVRLQVLSGAALPATARTE